MQRPIGIAVAANVDGTRSPRTTLLNEHNRCGMRWWGDMGIGASICVMCNCNVIKQKTRKTRSRILCDDAFVMHKSRDGT